MCTLDAFKVDLQRLLGAEIVLRFHLDDAYFEAIGAPDVRKGQLDTMLTIRKLTGGFELHFHTEGVVQVACDLCLDDMEQTVVADDCVMAKFGTTDDADDDTVTVDERNPVLDVSWLIYEFVELAIPVRHVHEPGGCNSAMTQLLHEHSSGQRDAENDNQTADPRWERLKNLKV